jgi:TRAP-type mannitol/chloroaromatic compound transport system permease small subunit
MRVLLGLSRWIDWLNGQIYKLVVFLVLVVTLLSAGNAVSRYAFSRSSNAWLELQWYMFAMIFLLGAAYTLKQDGHVRIDLISNRYSPRTKAWVDIVGTLLFLLPMTIGVIYFSYAGISNSFNIREISSDPGGLPRWPIKLFIPIGFFLLTLQGFSELIKNIAFLQGKYDPNTDKPKVPGVNP